MKFRIYQHLRAQNDINGNPRRVFVLYEVMPTKYGKEFAALNGHRNVTTGTADIIGVYDEGYNGRPEVINHLPCLAEAHITPKEYRGWLATGRELMSASPWSYSVAADSFTAAGWLSRPAFTREDCEAEARAYLKARGGGEAIIYKGTRIVRRFTVAAPRG